MNDFIENVLHATAEFEELGDCEVLHSNELLRQHLTDPAVKELGKTLRSTRKNAAPRPTGFKKEKIREECYVCGKMLVDIDGLKRHMLIHKNIRKYSCKVCNKQFHTAGNRSKHYQCVHLKFKAFHCPFCTRDFSSKSNLDMHIATHTGVKKFKCNVCDAAFSRNWVLTNHMYIHTGETPYKCDVCPYACRDGSTLRKHKRRHGLEPFYKCTFCGKRYAEKTHLKGHIAEHLGAETKIFHCELCTMRFKVKHALVNHMKIKHFNIKRWRCKICTGAYWSEERLRLHHEERHLSHREEQQVFICGEKDCGKIFKSKSNLVRHGRTHGFGGGRKAGTCSTCGRQFRSVARAKKHEENVHREGDRKQTCPRCTRIFFTKRHLIIHMKRHNNGGTFYYCHHCDWGYSTKPLLWQHIKTSHQFDMQGFPCQFPDCKKQFWRESIVKKHMQRVHKVKYIRPVVRTPPKLEDTPNTQIQVAELHIDAEGVEVKQELMDEFLEVLGIPDFENFGDEGKKESYKEEETDSKDFEVFTVPQPQIKNELKIKSEKFQINSRKDVSELNDEEMSNIAKKLKSNLRKNQRKAEAIIRYHYTKRFNRLPKVPEDIFNHFIKTRTSDETDGESQEIDSNTKNIKEEPVESLFEDDSETEIDCETCIDKTTTRSNELRQKPVEIECESEENNLAKTDKVATENEETHCDISKTTCEYGDSLSISIGNVKTCKIGDINSKNKKKYETLCETSKIVNENKEIDSQNEDNNINNADITKCQGLKIRCGTKTQSETTKCLSGNFKLMSETDKTDCANKETRCETQKTECEKHKIIPETGKASCGNKETQCENPIAKNCDETPRESQSGRPRRKRTLANYTDYRVMAGLTPTRKKYWNWNRANDFFVDDKSDRKEKSKNISKKNVAKTTIESENDLYSGNPLDKVLVGNVKQNYNKFYKTTVCVEQCYTCMQIFPNQEDLDQHMLSEHSIVKHQSRTKKCPYCDYCCKYNMKRHIKLIHGITFLDKLTPIEVPKKKSTEKSLSPSKKKLVCKNGVWHVVEENIADNSEKTIEIKDSNMSISDYLKKMSDLSKIATKTKKETLYPCNKCSKICVAYCGLKVHMRVHDPDAKPFKPKIWKHKVVTNTRTADIIEFSDAEYFSVYPKYKKEVRDLTIFKSDLLRIANTKKAIKINGGQRTEITNDDVTETFKTKLSSLKHNDIAQKAKTDQNIVYEIRSSNGNVSKNVETDLTIAINNDKVENSRDINKNSIENVEKQYKVNLEEQQHLNKATTNSIINNVYVKTRISNRRSSKNVEQRSINSKNVKQRSINSKKVETKSTTSSVLNINLKTEIKKSKTIVTHIQDPQILIKNIPINSKDIDIFPKPTISNVKYQNKNSNTSQTENLLKIAKRNVVTNKIPLDISKKIKNVSPNITFLKGTKTVKKPIVFKRRLPEANKNYITGREKKELKCLLCSKVFDDIRMLEKHLYEHICGKSLNNKPTNEHFLN